MARPPLAAGCGLFNSCTCDESWSCVCMRGRAGCRSGILKMVVPTVVGVERGGDQARLYSGPGQRQAFESHEASASARRGRHVAVLI